MQSLLRNKFGWKENNKWQQVKVQGIPRCYLLTYTIALNKLIRNHKELIDDVIKENGGFIKLPIDIKMLEDYLGDFEIEYMTFSADAKHLSGFWKIDKDKDNKFLIYYNTNCSVERQKFTKIHEIFHIIQFLDLEIRNLLDYLRLSTILPNEYINKLIEKSADKGASMFLMPNQYVKDKYMEIKDIQEMASIFQVSKEAMYWRLKECKQIF
jgi:Zn-dependent peptidase ImmA (M78 family)